MTLSHGRSYLAIPGPTVVPDAVLRAMHRASPNIYEGDLIDMTWSLIPDLRAIARTSGKVAIYISNGHGTWEAALANVLAPGDTILSLVTGRFGVGWADMAEKRGLSVDRLDFGMASPVDLDLFEDRLRADKEHRIKAVLATHTDTSSSARSDMAGLRAALDATGHPALLMADCIASMACDRFEMDEWGVDLAVAASQKGLMMTPGLGFVWFGDKAIAARARLDRVSSYWDWTPRADPEGFYQLFAGTAPTHLLHGLRAALDLIMDEGIENVWARHETLARAVWAAVEAWGAGDGVMRLNIADPAHRSHAVTSISLPAPDGDRLRRWTEDMAGVTLGVGLGMAEPGSPNAGAHFRLGHMGHVNAHMLMGALGVMEAGLVALDVPRGDGGLSAAAEVIGKRA
ncbi:aminotransferase class V-fold PLP-dependent enzyme [Roseovarius sp. SCSIO 43702]|uniref:pyridoxal-phosphate-dependent aminotransferase family protein n=1 Tax=Roseovarius sp. SCSIO 43702 TaxID=2823043 RepID=UPI001C73C137|nr:aminotransferase class V-fold PLP-dependent enzyme [Roseovarius sp. SCSIO 43702]QYX57398.1 aminotransferase class V-fold PLP-dependent enzyme [Roseovarius sp. SCSIO 43702]